MDAGNTELGFRGQKFGRCGQQKQIIASQTPDAASIEVPVGTLQGLYIIQWLGTELVGSDRQRQDFKKTRSQPQMVGNGRSGAHKASTHGFL
jgi:hypothetical protein